MFIQYALSHPTYGIVCILSIWVLLRVIAEVKKDEGDSNNDGDDGGDIDTPDLDLPLPPGVSAPIDEKEEALV